ncbi:MAG: orotidine-5'-phosphate decarboxylase [Candidatus Omnitrophota bacterium]
MNKKPQLILALDVDTHKQAMRLVNLLRPQIKIFKVGLQLYTACGPRIIQDIRKAGAGVFLDLKFNDIPNTMVNAAREVLKYKVAMFTVHTLAGPTALKEVANTCRRSKTKILGVTLLTSIYPRFLKDLGIERALSGEVLYLARMAKRCGLDGVVCSVQEAEMIRKHLGKNFIIVTPGIRPAGITKGDQKRAATPQEASRVGSNYLVVGRPILESADPALTAKGLLKR